MGLRSVFANAAAAAFTAVGDIATTVTYRRSVTTYVPSTGANSVVNTDYTVSSILVKYSEAELTLDPSLKVSDQKMIVQQASLAVTPSTQTDTVIAHGKTYKVVNYVPDPAGATYTVQLRAP